MVFLNEVITDYSFFFAQVSSRKSPADQSPRATSPCAPTGLWQFILKMKYSATALFTTENRHAEAKFLGAAATGAGATRVLRHDACSSRGSSYYAALNFMISVALTVGLSAHFFV